ncbi:iron uptake porin [Aerosakkonemataceae cyanobacterium BLCC-F154]|uniref:Iron uptake porin n=1 Tax=Floridaenema fluviatile BLCC-F154 TaxID=3153640 RepID=A0ABV4Y803_9CYAN
MLNISCNKAVMGSAVLSVSLALSTGAIATTPPTTPENSNLETNLTQTTLEQINQYTNENQPEENSLEQVTSVSQLRDVQPTDWAFQALQSLVERYGCIEGYPDRTYRGNRAMTRYEFAAGLNSCLDRIQELIAALPQGISKEDLDRLRRLQEEFTVELANLRGRVDNLEARVTKVESQQFSTTTKLEGEVIFAPASIFAGDDAFGNRLDRNPIFGYRARLNFVTSFTGKDTLLTRLQAGNLPAFSSITNTPEGDLFFGAGPFETADNNLVLDELSYTFPIGEKTEVIISANASGTDGFTDTLNPYFDGDGATGALSRFGTRPAIYYLTEGTGIGIRHKFTESIEVSLGYRADSGTSSSPFPGEGLFNGPYGALAQLTFQPSERFKFGLTYAHSYNTSLLTGSRLANLRSTLEAFQPFAGDNNLPISSNAYGAGFSWQINPGFVIGGWGGYINTRTLSTLDGQLNRGSLDIYYGAVTLAFPDLLKPGSLGGIIVGVEPIADATPRLSTDLFRAGLGGDDDDVSFHVEAFYQFQLTDNISITPGVIWLTAPDHNSSNSDIFIGTIRTTFTF